MLGKVVGKKIQRDTNVKSVMVRWPMIERARLGIKLLTKNLDRESNSKKSGKKMAALGEKSLPILEPI